MKNITDLEHLKKEFYKMKEEFGFAFIETDMRACFNPTRMKVIKKATLKLVEAVKSFCPNCKMPGFTITEAKKGLPCQWCNLPTQSTLSHIYTCKKCNFSSEKKYPHDKKTENPMYCDFCNP